MSSMTTELPIADGRMPVHVAVPEGEGPWPAVVVVHDALGMTTDLRNQADWLASEGYVAAAPDLYSRGGRLRCMFATIRAVMRREGPVFEDLETVRSWLVDRGDCTGRVGTIGFCMGGGIALLLAAHRGFGASSVNYGAVPKDATELLANACPIVGSYGARDRSLQGAAEKLQESLTANGVPHDVEEYPDAGHAFLNDHDPDEVPLFVTLTAPFVRSEYDPEAAAHARGRIVAFFDAHLKGAASSTVQG